MSLSQVMDKLNEHKKDTHLLVVTGGEPLLQARALLVLFTLKSFPFTLVEIETNGTQDVSLFNSLRGGALRINCSPKLQLFGEKAALHPSVLASAWSTFKFVCSNMEDVETAQGVVDQYGIHPSRVWLMPEGQTPEEVQDKSWIADEALKRGWNFTSRLHLLLWGSVRGH